LSAWTAPETTPSNRCCGVTSQSTVDMPPDASTPICSRSQVEKVGTRGVVTEDIGTPTKQAGGVPNIA